MANFLKDSEWDEMQPEELPDASVMQDLPSNRDMERQRNLMQQLQDLREQQTSDIDQEIQDESSDVLAAMPEPESLAATPEAESLPAMDTPQSRYQDLLNARRDQMRNLAFARGAQQIGQGLIGGQTGNFKSDNSGIEALERLSSMPVEDYSLAQKAKKADTDLRDDDVSRDPNSQQSIITRAYAKDKLALPVTEEMSAWDISQLLKTVGRPSASSNKGQITRRYNPETKATELGIFNPATGKIEWTGDIAGFAGQVRTDPRTGELINVQPAIGYKTGDVTAPSADMPKDKSQPIALDKSYLTTKQNDALDKARGDFRNETETTRQSMQAADNIGALISYGRGAGADLIRAIQNQLARANGEKGAMSQADVEGFGGEQSILAAVKRWTTVKAFGELPEDDRKILTGLGQVMKERSKEYYDKQTNFFVNNMYKDLKSSPNLKELNFQPSAVRNLLGAEEFVSLKKIPVVSKKTGKTLYMTEEAAKEAKSKGLIE